MGCRDGQFENDCLQHEEDSSMETPLISRSEDILGGMPVFYGTRVPVQNLVDYLAGGETIDEFLDDFPTVLRFLESARETLVAHVDANPH
jgi:uncharacterized protein (DUF433 family)